MQRTVFVSLVVSVSILWNSAALAGDSSFLFGISEGVAEQSSVIELQDKYRGLGDYLGKVIKHKVIVESSQGFKSAFANVEKARYDLMFIRPSNVTGRAIRDSKYQVVAVAKGSFAANFIVRKGDERFKKPEDILRARIAMPDESALMSRVGLATLRDMGGGANGGLTVRHTRFQDAVVFMVDKDFADVGVVSPAQAIAWQKKGGTILMKSKPIPFWAIIASPKVSAAAIAEMQSALTEMDKTPEGQAILQRIGVKGWGPGNGNDYLELLKWIGV
jgi:phosphonate transport system substrate-binding protein